MVYIFRSLPYLYLELTAKGDPKEREHVYDTIRYLERQGLLAKKQAMHSLYFLHLTKKGYTYVTTNLFKRFDMRAFPRTLRPKDSFYTYRTDRSLKGTVSEHQYMHFSFIWEWITQHPHLLIGDLEVYEDSNVNHCQLTIRYGGKDIRISPDVLILSPHHKDTTGYYKRAVIVENDTGGETYKTLFGKFLQYAVLINNLQNALITAGEVYFIFHSKERAEQFFTSEQKGMMQFIKNNYYFSGGNIKDLPINELLNAYYQSPFQVYYGIFNKDDKHNPHTFTRYNLGEHILKARPELKIFIHSRKGNAHDHQEEEEKQQKEQKEEELKRAQLIKNMEQTQ